MSMRLTENKLILLEPGGYLRAGGKGSATLKLKQKVQGLVIKAVKDPAATHLTVLVNGHLVNVWTQEKCDK